MIGLKAWKSIQNLKLVMIYGPLDIKDIHSMHQEPKNTTI